MLGQKILLTISNLRIALFGATNVVKNSDKEKYVYNASGITFDWGGSWRFGNDFTRNVVIFDADNSSSFFFFFYLGFLSRTFTIHGTAVEGGGYLFNSSLPLPPTTQP